MAGTVYGERTKRPLQLGITFVKHIFQNKKRRSGGAALGILLLVYPSFVGVEVGKRD